MNRARCLLISAILEIGIGVALVLRPSLPLALLLGVEETVPEALLVGRIAGAALLALGVASWLARADALGPAQRGLFTGLIIYDVGAAALLAYAALGLGLVGVLLWPGVALHAAMAAWCGLCLLRASS